MKLYSWRKVAHIQLKGGWNTCGVSDGMFYVDLGKLNERESIKSEGLREWRGAWLQEVHWVCQMRSVCVNYKEKSLLK